MKVQFLALFTLLVGALASPYPQAELDAPAVEDMALEERAVLRTTTQTRVFAKTTRTITRTFGRDQPPNTKTVKNTKTVTNNPGTVTVTATTTKTKKPKTTTTTATSPTTKPSGGCPSQPVSVCTNNTVGCACRLLLGLTGTCNGGILGLFKCNVL